MTLRGDVFTAFRAGPGMSGRHGGKGTLWEPVQCRGGGASRRSGRGCARAHADRNLTCPSAAAASPACARRSTMPRTARPGSISSMRRGRLVKQPALSRSAGPGAGLRPPPDRRRHRARRAAGADRRHVARFLHRILRRAVCRRRAGPGRHAGRARHHAQAISSSCADRSPLRAPSAVLAPDELDGFARDGGRGTTARLAGPMASSTPCRNTPDRCGRFGAARRATSSSPRAARASRAASTSARTS